MIPFITFLLPAIIHGLNSQCPSYQLGKIDNLMSCYSKHSDQEIILQDCSKGYKCVIDKDDDGEFGTCEPSNSFRYQLSYPGGICEKDEDCLVLKCSDGKCEGKDKGEKCQGTADCYYGLQCFHGFCAHPKPKGSLCVNHSQCEFPLICFKGRCTGLFTIDNGREMKYEDGFLCKSGRVYNGKCDSVININCECDDETPCRYKDYNNEEIVLEGACSCPYENNQNSKKRCELGNGNNTAWDKAIMILNKTMLPSNVKKCNLEEPRPSFCLESLKTVWDTRKDQIFLDKHIIEGRYGAVLPSSDNKPNNHKRVDNSIRYKEMIMKILFNYDTSPLIPDKGFKCPLYKTEHNHVLKNNTCIYTTNPLNEKGDGIVSYINPIQCDIGYECNHDTSTIPIQPTYNSSCVPKSLWKSSYHLKMPGDPCSSSSQCQKGNYDDVGQCSNDTNKCSGHPIDSPCISNMDCLNGLFCSEGNLCESQHFLNESCRDVYDCQNKYGCINSTCQEYFSLASGQYLNSINPDASFCQCGTVSPNSNQCIELRYYNGTPNQDGFIPCEKGESLCYYTSGKEEEEGKVIVKECQCGFNPFGHSFCQLSHDQHRNEWLKYFAKKKAVIDNKCHSLKRFDCYDNEKDYTNEAKYYFRLSANAHLFYEAEEEVVKMLNGIRLHLSMLLLGVLGMIIL